MLSPAKNGYLVVSGMDRFDEIRQMEDHSRWVGITHMTLKRTSSDWSTTEYGQLKVIRGRVAPIVYGVPDIQGVIHSYDTFDTLLDAGWRVD